MKDILGKDNDSYRNRIEFQLTPEMNWLNIEIDHVKPICMLNIYNDDEIRECFNWKKIQTLIKAIDKKEGNDFFSIISYILLRSINFQLYMKKDNIQTSINETYSKPPGKNYPTNKFL